MMFSNDSKKVKNSLLFQAIETGDLATLKILLQSGCNLEQKNCNALTPMQVAVALDHVEIARTLLSAGATLDGLDEHIFGNAVYRRKLDTISFLIEIGIDVNMRFYEDEDRTALMEAVNTGDLDIVKKLVESGADVNAVSRKNAYALMNATRPDLKEIYDYLAPLTSSKLRELAEKIRPPIKNKQEEIQRNRDELQKILKLFNSSKKRKPKKTDR